MRALRLGSYSIVATRPGTPNLSRLKSMRRYWRRPLPCRCRTVILPWLLRPARFGRRSVRLFSGRSVVTSSKPDVVMKRRPGLVGLYFLTAIRLQTPEEAFEPLARAERDHGLLPVGGTAADAPLAAAPRLALHRDRVHCDDLDALVRVMLLERPRDLGLRRVLGDPERVPTGLVQRVRLLGDDRAVDDLGGGPAHASSLLCPLARPLPCPRLCLPGVSFLASLGSAAGSSSEPPEVRRRRAGAGSGAAVAPSAARAEGSPNVSTSGSSASLWTSRRSC